MESSSPPSKRHRANVSSSASPPTAAMTPPSIAELPDVVLGHILSFAFARDLEAMTTASRVVAHALSRFPLWRTLFRQRWAALNFPLDPAVPLEIDERLRALFPKSTTESRMFQLLAHAVTPVPAYADTAATMRYRRDTWMDHTVVSLSEDAASKAGRHRWRPRALDFAFNGRFLGGDRCVRANAPFQTTFHVQVLCVRVPDAAKDQPKAKYVVGVAASGYFELTVSKRERPQPSHRVGGSDMTAIGVCEQRFNLVGKQPGWTSTSYGYHGDDGHFFHGSGEGRHFGPSFDVGDTVGCGVRRSMRDLRSFVFFTHTGDLIPAGDRGIECGHEEWFPVVGLDSANAIHVNYGQEPFRYDAIVDELFDECRGMTSILADQLQWYTISDSDGESSSDDERSDESSDTGDEDDADGFLHHMLFGGRRLELGAGGGGALMLGDDGSVGSELESEDEENDGSDTDGDDDGGGSEQEHTGDNVRENDAAATAAPGTDGTVGAA
ncbi:hypothetical protein PybrP1_001124 [[Pythium] brassicae (nom. inval.)]|nr:hypothetical protein PybrP1_001124 [[Pythium] brassicae (nom. inval.)]